MSNDDHKTTSNDGFVPTLCANCGATENFFLLGNFHFCGMCGRKVLPLTTPAPSSSSSSSASSPSKITNVNANLNANVNPNPNSNVNVNANVNDNTNNAAGDDGSTSASFPDDFPDDAPEIKTRQEAHTSPQRAKNSTTPSSTTNSPVKYSSPPPSSSSSSSAAAAAATTTTTLSSSAASSSSGTSSPLQKDADENGKNNNTYGLSAAAYASLVSSVQSRLRSENEILSLDYSAVENERNQAVAECNELKATLDATIQQMENIINQTNMTKHDLTARLEISEDETSSLARQLENEKSNTARLTSEIIHHRSVIADHERTVAALKAEMENLKTRLADSESSYAGLVSQAQDKLSESGRRYSEMVVSLTEQTQINIQLNNDNQRLKEQREQDASRLVSLESSVRDMSSKLSSLDSSASSLRSSLLSVSGERDQVMLLYQQTLSKLSDSSGVQASYKQQVAEGREKIRRLEAHIKKMDGLEAENAKLKESINVVQHENQKLKSQLFDQISGGGAGGPGGPNGPAIEILKQECADLNAKLHAKTSENDELLAMCEQLVKQVEELKSQKT